MKLVRIGGRRGRWTHKFRRRIEGKTNYYLRKKLILSRKIRFVPRFSLKHVTVQLIEAREGGDHTLVSAHVHELAKYGWPEGKNLPSAYLVGFLAGCKAISKGIREAILDIGLRRSTKGARVYACLKGAVDAGMKIPHGVEILPDNSRIRGEHIANYAKMLKEKDISAYKRQFSEYLRRNIEPEKLPEYFDKVLDNLRKSYTFTKDA